MIFSLGKHIRQIINGVKVQTRRSSDRYQVGKTYAIQPGRTKPGIPQGRILITKKTKEKYWEKISEVDAAQEGMYQPEEFEDLYEKIHPGWKTRWAYTFRFIPSKEDSKTW